MSKADKENKLPALAEDTQVEAMPDGAPATTEDTSSAYDYPAEPPPPLDVRDIPLTDIAELDNVRPEYYGIDELAESMHSQNQLHPVCVRPAENASEHGKPYELVYGYRRMRAAKQLGWDKIRTIVREVPDKRLLEVMITENLQRRDMSPIAEARAMRAMIELGEMRPSAVANKLGVSRSHVSHRLRLLELRPEVMQLVDTGELKASAGESIAALDEKKQLQVARKAVKSQLSVQRIDAIVRTVKEEKKDIPADDLAPIERVRPEDVLELPALEARDDLSVLDYERLSVYALLRNGMDQEMLEYLRESHSIRWEQIWEWVRLLDLPSARALRNRLLRRYIESAHRYPTLEITLRQELGKPAMRPNQLGLPSIDELLALEDEWLDDEVDSE